MQTSTRSYSAATPNGAATSVARAVDATKTYGKGDTAVVALNDVSIDVPAGEFTAIMGPSGSGKSTLMHCLAGLDTLTSGQIFLGDVEVSTLSDKELTILRRERIGFVFQAFNLIPTLNAEENITLPMDLAGTKPDPAWLDVGHRDGRPGRPSVASPIGAVRRPAAAGRRRPGARQPASGHLRR